MRSDRRRNKGFTWGKVYWAIIGLLIICILISLLMLWRLFLREAEDVNSNPDNIAEENVAGEEGGEGETTETSETSTSDQREDNPPKDESQDEINYRRSATASSELPEEGNVTYVARNVYDGDLLTAWTENAYGMGEGEWIDVSFDKKIPGGLTIYNGYQKTADLYYQNARIMDAEIEFLNGQRYRVTLNDEMGAQTVIFPGLKKTNGFRLTILSAYEGTTWDDNNITEIIIADSEDIDEETMGTIINATPID